MAIACTASSFELMHTSSSRFASSAPLGELLAQHT
jgi:hypothetical protein